MRRVRATTTAALCAAVALGGCSGGDPSSSAQPARDVPASAARPSPETAASPAPRGTGHRHTGAGAMGTGWGPTRAELSRAARLAAGLSLEQLAGQVIVARYSGARAPVSLVDDLHLGGVVVFDDNIVSTDRLRAANRTLQASARRAGRRWPVFIAVDQEGGLVERVKGRATRFPSFMTAGAAADPRLTRAAYAASGAELKDLGFTTVFAPTADVTSGPDDPTIGSRSAGSRARAVAAQVDAAVAGYLSAGVVPVVKHFPGHGSVPADSHLRLPVQDKALAALERTDLVPFRSAVSRGAASVMVAHIDVRAVDPGTPSSLSRKVVTGLLRGRLGFDGLVVTDALEMPAVTDRFGSARSAVRALSAGADVLLMPPDPRAARDAIVAAVREGRLPRGRLLRAATRQIAVLQHQQALDPSVSRVPGSSGAQSRRLSAAGITMVSGRCGRRLVGPSVEAVGPAPAVASFEAAARRAGLRTGTGTRVALLGYGESGTTSDVVVSLDTPYALSDSTGTIARVAAYGDTPGVMRALVRVLLGRASAPGRLPVEVGGISRTGCPSADGGGR